MKILFLNPSSQIGGAETVLMSILGRLKEKIFAVVVLPKPGPLADALRNLGIDVRIVPINESILKLGRFSNPVSLLLAIPKLLSLIPVVLKIRTMVKREGVTIVHSNGIKAHFLSAALSLLLKVKTVWYLHDFVHNRKFYKFFLFLAQICPSELIADSHAVAKDLNSNQKISRKLVVIHYGVDLDKFRPDQGIRTNQELIKVGIVGILAPWKGHKVFIQAASQVAARSPKAYFFIIGDEIYDTDGHRGYRRELEDLVTKQGLSDRIIFTGYQADIVKAISSLDLLVHASVDPEPFGRVLIEAMACSKPLIATRGGGTTEIVEDGVSGILIPPGNCDKMAEVMLYLINQEEERKKMGEAGRRRAEKFFNLEHQVKKLEEVYQSLVKL